MFEETKELKTVGSVDQCQPNPLKKKKGLGGMASRLSNQAANVNSLLLQERMVGRREKNVYCTGARLRKSIYKTWVKNLLTKT